MSLRLSRPVSDEARLLWLETAAAEASKDVTEGRNWLNGAIRNQLSNLATNLNTAVETLTARYAARRDAVDRRVLANEALKIHVGMAFQNLKNLNRMGTLTQAQLDHYKIPSEKRFPTPRSYERLLKAADALMSGNTRAVELGLPPIPAPTPETLQTLRDEAHAAASAVRAGKLEVKLAIQELDLLRAQTYTLWRLVASELRTVLMDLTAGQRRDQFRRYGYLYLGTLAPGQTTSDGTTTPTTGDDTPTGDDTNNGETTDPTGNGTDAGTGDPPTDGQNQDQESQQTTTSTV